MNSAAGRFVNDLYADLRDRHLLPVVIVLAVAIIAVPVLLRAEAPASPPAPLLAPAGNATAAVPAVLVDDPGLRDYRERLDALRSKNPFKAPFSLPSAEVESVEDVSAAGGTVSDTSVAPVDSGSASVATDTGSTGSSSGSTDTGTIVSPPPSTDSPTSNVSSGDDSSTDGGGGVQESWYRYSHRIDVVTGRAGEAAEQTGVKKLSVLPGKANPVLVFVGVTDDENAAVFAVSRDVTGASGEGECLPSAGSCEFLRLEEGEQRTLDYAPPSGFGDGSYVLRLKAIDRVIVEQGEGSFADTDKEKKLGSPSEIAAWIGLGE
jgi:hypothetical protein